MFVICNEHEINNGEKITNNQNKRNYNAQKLPSGESPCKWKGFNVIVIAFHSKYKKIILIGKILINFINFFYLDYLVLIKMSDQVGLVYISSYFIDI